MRASMSLASHACLKSLTMSALLGGRSRGSLRRADAAAGRGGQLAAGRRGAADDLGHFGEGVAEDVVQDERDALGRGHRLEHDEEGHVDRLVEGDPVGRVGRAAARPSADPLRAVGQRLRDPFAHVALPPGPRRAEQVEADATGDRRQPGAGGLDGFLLLPGHGVPAGVGLLHDVLGVGQGAEEPVGEVDQLTPLAHDRAQARVEPAVSWLGLRAHGVADSLGRICPPVRRDSAPKCEVGASPHIPSGCVVVLMRRTVWRHPPAPPDRTREGEDRSWNP